MSNADNKLFCDPNKSQLYKDIESMNTDKTIEDLVIGFFVGVAFIMILSFITGWGQDIPGTGGLTRYQLAEMLYECDRDSRKPKGYCVADVNIRPSEVQE